MYIKKKKSRNFFCPELDKIAFKKWFQETLPMGLNILNVKWTKMLYFQEKKDSAKCIFLVPDLEKMGLHILNLK